MLKSDNYGPIMTIGLTKKENPFLDPQNNLLNFDIQPNPFYRI